LTSKEASGHGRRRQKLVAFGVLQHNEAIVGLLVDPTGADPDQATNLDVQVVGS
jgi:hypothetical protein